MVQTRSGQSKEHKEVHVVTGGGGYVGQNLAEKLLEKHVSVVLLDINKPKDNLFGDVTFIQGDIRNYDDVKKACEKADIVYHLASYGMSGREQVRITVGIPRYRTT